MASLSTIHIGDIVEVDVKGRRAFAVVHDKRSRSKGEPARLSIKPIGGGFNWHEVTAYQVVTHYRRTKNTKKSVAIKVRPKEQEPVHWT